MDVVKDFLDVLQNMEASIKVVAENRRDLLDKDIIVALEKLMSVYEREKKRLPSLPVLLPEKSMAAFNSIKSACELRLHRESGEIVAGEIGYLLPLRFMIPCLKRLHTSAIFWTKKDGPRGYLKFMGNFV